MGKPIRDFYKFFIISGCGWLLDVFITMALVQISFGPFIASMIGAGTAVTFVYIMSLFAVFHVDREYNLIGYISYVVWQVFAISLASVLVSIIAYLIEPPLLEVVGKRPIGENSYFPNALSWASGIAKFVVTPLTLVANFLFMRWLTARLRLYPGREF